MQKEGEAETGLVPFTLWPAQREALEVIERERFLVLPKGRQVGITWLELAAMLHAGTTAGNRLFNIARQSGDDAKDAIRRLLILAGYDPNSEPPNMRVLPASPMPEAWRPQVIGKTLTSLTLANGSRYQTKTATRHMARGDAAYWTLCDEYASWPWPEEQLAALEPGAHRVHVVSTGQGDEDAFAKLYRVAREQTGKWAAHFVSAEADPRRDAAWFAQNIEGSPDPDRARREWARDVVDVFRPREGAFFKVFSHSRSVREFDFVPGWPTELGIDWGLVRPACVFVQVAPSGQPFVLDEYLPEDVRTSDFGAGILERLRGYGIDPQSVVTVADPAGSSRNTQTRRSEFDVFRGLGLPPRGKPSRIVDGVVLMSELIGHPDEEKRLVVHPRCSGLIGALGNVEAYKNDPDLYDHDHPVYSHVLDALRYWIVHRWRGHRLPAQGGAPRRQRTASRSLSF